MLSINVNEETVLKELGLDSARDLFNLICSNRNYLRQWLTWVDETKHIDDTINYIQSTSDGDMFCGRYVMEIRHRDSLAGIIDFHNGDKINMIIEIGYWLAEKFQGKGIMTECCRSCINYAFANLGFNRVVIKCAIANERSKAIPERLHFTFEGIEREGQNLNGEYTDLMVFSMLKKDWTGYGKISNSIL
ncbi:MAG: GNAT family protein [Ignavibacteriaceae bacterium]|nr:GNAT family protein [Ignavibacteriaceae bacterium]